MLGKFISIYERFDDNTAKTFVKKIATNMEQEITELLTPKQITQFLETYEIDAQALYLVNDMIKYLLNNAASGKSFDNIKELLIKNNLTNDKIAILEECFQENANDIFSYMKDNGIVNHNLVHEIKSEVILPLSGSTLPINEMQQMNNKLSYYFSEDVHNPKTIMNFKIKGNNEASEHLEEFNFMIDKADQQLLFEETELIKEKLDTLVSLG